MGHQSPPRRHHQRRQAPAKRSVSMACMHCTDAPCAAVWPGCRASTPPADGCGASLQGPLHRLRILLFMHVRSARRSTRRLETSGSRGKDGQVHLLRGAGRRQTPLRLSTPNTAPTVSPRASCRFAPRCARPSRCSRAMARIIAEIYKGARDENAVTVSGMWGWEKRPAYSDFADRLMQLSSHLVRRRSRKPGNRRAFLRWQDHIRPARPVFPRPQPIRPQFSRPLCAAFAFAVSWLRIPRRRSFRSSPTAEGRAGRQAPECAEGRRQDHRPASPFRMRWPPA